MIDPTGIDDRQSSTRRDWILYKESVEMNKKAIDSKIRELKERLIEEIVDHANYLLSDVDNMCQANIDIANQNITKLAQCGQNNHMSNGTTSNSKHPKPTPRNRHEDYMVQPELHVENQSIVVPKWRPITLQSTPNDYVITQLFGTLQTSEPCSTASLTRTVIDSMKVKSSLEVKRSFSVKSKLDSLPCGVSDMTCLPNGNVLVVDKSNKVVKMLNGKTGEMMENIGRHQLSAPGRILAARHKAKIYISDSEKRCVMVFSRDGKFLANFITSLKNPSSIAETSRGHIVIVEFSTRAVITYSADGIQLNVFHLEDMSSPSHLAIGLAHKKQSDEVQADVNDGEDIIYVSDWRGRSVHAYNMEGCRLWVYHHQTKEKKTSRSGSITSLKSTERMTSQRSVPSSPLAASGKEQSLQKSVFAKDRGHSRTGSDSSFFDTTPGEFSRSSSSSSIASSNSFPGKTLPLDTTGTPPSPSNGTLAALPFKQPQGMFADRFGNLLVSDAQGACIIVLNAMTGDFKGVLAMRDPKKKMILPMALHCDGSTGLVIAEYTGVLKMCAYLEQDTDITEPEMKTDDVITMLTIDPVNVDLQQREETSTV